MTILWYFGNIITLVSVIFGGYFAYNLYKVTRYRAVLCFLVAMAYCFVLRCYTLSLDIMGLANIYGKELSSVSYVLIAFGMYYLYKAVAIFIEHNGGKH